MNSMHVRVDTDTGRIAATSKDYPFGEDDQMFDFPDGFDFLHQRDYRIVNNELVNDPLPVPVPPPSPEEINAANINYLSMMMGVAL